MKRGRPIALGLISAAWCSRPALLAARTRPCRARSSSSGGATTCAAADAYRRVLAGRPADAAALLGLERSLMPLGRSTDILPQVRDALAALKPSPTSGAVFGVALRAWAAADVPDSMRAVAERWAAAAPGDETPFREWGAAALGQRDRAGARDAYRAGTSGSASTRRPRARNGAARLRRRRLPGRPPRVAAGDPARAGVSHHRRQYAEPGARLDPVGSAVDPRPRARPARPTPGGRSPRPLGRSARRAREAPRRAPTRFRRRRGRAPRTGRSAPHRCKGARRARPRAGRSS